MVDARRRFGTLGEHRAAAFLEQKGYEIVLHQARTPYGEIDLVCRDGNEVVFVEVKTRADTSHGDPEDSITPEKLRHIVNSARHILEDRKWLQMDWRIDVLAIQFASGAAQIDHLEDVDIPEELW